MKYYAFMLALLFTVNTYAEVTYESSFLELREGFVGESLGVEVEAISIENDQKVIKLGLPNLTGELDNLRLLDSNNDQIAVKQRYEVLKDHEDTPKGLILYLDKRHKRAFKIVYEVDEAN